MAKADSTSDLATLQQARPYIRSLAAFVLYLTGRYYNRTTSDKETILKDVYQSADCFLNQLEADIKDNAKS